MRRGVTRLLADAQVGPRSAARQSPPLTTPIADQYLRLSRVGSLPPSVSTDQAIAQPALAANGRWPTQRIHNARQGSPAKLPACTTFKA